ncbi:MAG: hypothetical protein COB24_08225 [Hyphomicrobiales bacterium]|nr:MAG: hypothetical protein COB24_08225 [Hyphomicrobiales bacterium]
MSIPLAAPNGDGQSALPHPKVFGLISHEKHAEKTAWRLYSEFRQILAYLAYEFALGGELACDQRLSGLARERSERARPSKATKCPWGAVPSITSKYLARLKIYNKKRARCVSSCPL